MELAPSGHIARHHDTSRHDELPGVALRVLGRVNEQPEDGRWQGLPPDGPGVEGSLGRSLPQRVCEPLGGSADRRHKVGRRLGSVCPLNCESGELLGRERLSAGISRHAVQHAHDVPQVEPHGRDAGRSRLQTGIGKRGERRADVLDGMLEGVRDRLKDWSDARDGSSEPWLRRDEHGKSGEAVAV